MPEGKARVLALTGAGVLSQVGMTLLIVGLNFGKTPPPVPPNAVQAAALAFSGTGAKASAPFETDQDPLGPVTPLPRSMPIRLSVPRIGIDTALMGLGLQPDGEIEVPPDDSAAPAGWYRNLASPGESGTAVIVGHLDSPQAPAVFFNLGALRPGDHLSVLRADGSTAHFTVTEVGSYPRAQFPTDAVYGPSGTPVLRLVTCGGQYRKGEGYDGNVVVFADMDPDSITATAAPMPAARSIPSGTRRTAVNATPTPTPTRGRKPDSTDSDQPTVVRSHAAVSPEPDSSGEGPTSKPLPTRSSSVEPSAPRSAATPPLRSTPTVARSQRHESTADSGEERTPARPVYHHPEHPVHPAQPTYVPPPAIPSN